MQVHGARVLHLNAVVGSRTGCGATNVERTHRELCTRLTNRLRCNNTDGLTDVNGVASSKVTAVTGRANAESRFAGDGRTHVDFIYAARFEQVDHTLINQRAALRDHLTCRLIHGIRRERATQHTITERRDDVAAFDNWSHCEAFFGATVLLCNHEILRDIYQTTSQVTGVRCLQGCIGKTLTRAVRRRKVLRNVQTFTEVRGDRRLNDRAVRTRHQTAHTGKLSNLCGGATSTGVCVDINGVEGFLLLFFAVFVDY